MSAEHGRIYYDMLHRRPFDAGQRRNWKRLGFGAGVQPFYWKLGYNKVAGQHFFNVGPFFVSWNLPA